MAITLFYILHKNYLKKIRFHLSQQINTLKYSWAIGHINVGLNTYVLETHSVSIIRESFPHIYCDDGGRVGF